MHRKNCTCFAVHPHSENCRPDPNCPAGQSALAERARWDARCQRAAALTLDAVPSAGGAELELASRPQPHPTVDPAVASAARDELDRRAGLTPRWRSEVPAYLIEAAALLRSGE